MLTTYVNTRLELTNQKDFFESIRFSVYRTKELCDCKRGTRQAIVLVNPNDVHEQTFIRCKACVARKEAGNGNI